MTAVLIRIILRYASGALVAKGLLLPDDGALFADDPQVAAALEVGAGILIGVATECWYRLAVKWGWSK